MKRSVVPSWSVRINRRYYWSALHSLIWSLCIDDVTSSWRIDDKKMSVCRCQQTNKQTHTHGLYLLLIFGRSALKLHELRITIDVASWSPPETRQLPVTRFKRVQTAARFRLWKAERHRTHRVLTGLLSSTTVIIKMFQGETSQIKPEIKITTIHHRGFLWITSVLLSSVRLLTSSLPFFSSGHKQLKQAASNTLLFWKPILQSGGLNRAGALTAVWRHGVIMLSAGAAAGDRI